MVYSDHLKRNLSNFLLSKNILKFNNIKIKGQNNWREKNLNRDKKSRIRETKNLSTNADSRTDKILERLSELSLKKIKKNA